MLSNERSGSLFWNAPTGIPQKDTGEYRGDALELLQKEWEQVHNLHPQGTSTAPEGTQMAPAGLAALGVLLGWSNSVSSAKSGSYNIHFSWQKSML